MMTEQDMALLAYVIVNGKTVLSDAEKARLNEIADNHLRAGDRVIVTLGIPGAGNPPTVAGALTGTIREDGRIQVNLDDAIETMGDGMVVQTSVVFVDRSQILPEPATPPPATAEPLT